MKQMRFIASLSFIFLIIFVFTGCGYSNDSDVNRDELAEKYCADVLPENPYSEYESGHYAGYEWAKEKEPETCGGNSQSFIEGCEEYQRQLELLNECLD